MCVGSLGSSYIEAVFSDCSKLPQQGDFISDVISTKQSSISINEVVAANQQKDEAESEQLTSGDKVQKSLNEETSETGADTVAKVTEENPEDSRQKSGSTRAGANPAVIPSEQQQQPKTAPQKKQSKIPISANMAASMFDMNAASARQEVKLPSTDGVEYPRAASWASESLANVLKDEKGRQLFRVFLHDALAEENLSFIESYEKFKRMTDPAEKKQYIEEFFAKYSPYVNLSSVAMQKIKETAATDDPNPAAFTLAVKEVNRLLENDQFPRFKRSEVYVNFLEKLLPRAYAEKWTTSFEALLGNQIGRHYFRFFLRNIHAEENLRFWEAVIEFKQTKNKSPAMVNMARNIQKQYLVEGTHNEVFLPFGVRQTIEKRINDRDVDSGLFDEAVKHVEQVLKNDPYVRFLQSKEYNDLLAKLK